VGLSGGGEARGLGEHPLWVAGSGGACARSCALRPFESGATRYLRGWLGTPPGRRRSGSAMAREGPSGSGRVRAGQGRSAHGPLSHGTCLGLKPTRPALVCLAVIWFHLAGVALLETPTVWMRLGMQEQRALAIGGLARLLSWRKPLRAAARLSLVWRLLRQQPLSWLGVVGLGISPLVAPSPCNSLPFGSRLAPLPCCASGEACV